MIRSSGSFVRFADEPEQKVAREGQLRYRDEPLRYVIRDLNRHSYKQIVIDDQAAEELRFTGTRAAEPHRLMAAQLGEYLFRRSRERRQMRAVV
jgi:ferric-dicitrate binding protein FerR (iron transport regulator)